MNPMLYILIAMLVIGGVTWAVWPHINHWFRDSESLFFARLQMLIGAVWFALTSFDITPFLQLGGYGDWAPVWILGTGIITEVFRRLRDPDLGA